jgi:septum formation protein
MKRLILASASPARARLLVAAGIGFDVHPATVDETGLKREAIAQGCDPATAARRIATEKACSVARLHPGAIVLGSDQILDLDGETISKCRDPQEASALLRRLRGRTHELVTAAVLAVEGAELWNRTDICRMTMRCFTDAFLSEYVSRAGAALVQSVGCYELEGLGAQLFERVDGDYFSVLGLPLIPVLAALREHGVIAQ